MPRHQEGVQDPGTGAAAIVSSMGVDHGVEGASGNGSGVGALRQWCRARQRSGATRTLVQQQRQWSETADGLDHGVGPGKAMEEMGPKTALTLER